MNDHQSPPPSLTDENGLHQGRVSDDGHVSGSTEGSKRLTPIVDEARS